MLLDEYTEQAARTWSNTHPDALCERDLQIIHALVGLAEEWVEFKHAEADKRREELGDVFYYAATALREAGVDIRRVTGLIPVVNEWTRTEQAISDALGSAKKLIFFDMAGQVEPMREAIARALGGLIGVSRSCGWEPGDVCAENIEKLRARYPDGFELGGGNR